MVTRIDSNKLRLGMFIHNLGGSWMPHPFLRKSFLLKNAEDISRILEAGINEVWIDETKGESVAAEPPKLSKHAHQKLLPSLKQKLPRKKRKIPLQWQLRQFLPASFAMMPNSK